MKIQLNWYEPIELGTSSTLRQTLKEFDFSEIPEVAGIYIFYREKRNGTQEALYVGKSENIRKRFKDHCNNLNLVEGLEDTPQGRKMFIFSELKTRGDLPKALSQAERGYIQHLLENEHPLLNKKLMLDQFDIIKSSENIIDLVSEEIYVLIK